MNLIFKDQGELLARVENRKVVECDDNKVREFLESLILNNEISKFPEHIDRDQMLYDALKAFAFVNSYEMEEL